MKTIAIMSRKGGAGKTTIGIHLAVAAELWGMKTALFDLDPQASASSWSDKRGKPSPAVVSAHAARMPGLLEQAAAQSADLVIIDSAPNADAASLAAARAADLILIPCRPAAFDLSAIGTTLNLAVVAGKRDYVALNAARVNGRVGEGACPGLQDGGVEGCRPGAALPGRFLSCGQRSPHHARTRKQQQDCARDQDRQWRAGVGALPTAHQMVADVALMPNTPAPTRKPISNSTLRCHLWPRSCWTKRLRRGMGERPRRRARTESRSSLGEF